MAMERKYLSLTRLTEYDVEIKKVINAGDAATLASAKSYADGLAGGKSDKTHTHDDRYYTETEINSKISAINDSIGNITSGTTVVKEAEHADTADEATHATSADTATSATTATKATQDGNGKNIASTYETKTDASSKLTEAKGYTDTEIGKITAGTIVAGKATKDANGNTITSTYETKTDASSKLAEAKGYTDTKIADLLDNSTEAVDSIMELAEAMENNADAIEALEGIAAGKANATHSHAISDVTNLQSTLNAKATQSSLDSHTGNGDIHVTSALKGNWNTAYNHSQADHAPSGAQANVIETIKVNGTALTPTSKAVNITVPTNYLVAADIANKANKATTLAGYGITDAYTKTEVDSKLSTKANQSSLDSVSGVANEAKSAAATNLQSINAHTTAINGHTTRIGALEASIEEFEEITSDEILALFA